MPTIMTHMIVPLSLGLALGKRRISGPIMALGMGLAILPDADVIGFKFGIDYASQLGHRGASHALAIAALVTVAITLLYRPASQKAVSLFLFASMASHGLLDAFTNGGLGPALFWPLSEARYFAPFTPILVSPIGAGFFSGRGVAVILSELQWIWCPAILIALLGWSVRKREATSCRSLN